MKARIFLISLALLALAGCNHTTSPEAVIQAAYQKLMANDTRGFSELLIGDAFDQYGSLEGMIALQRKLAGYDVKLGKTLATGFEVHPSNRWISARHYSIQVFGKKGRGEATVLLTAGITCDVDYNWNGNNPHNNPHTGPWERIPVHYSLMAMDAGAEAVEPVTPVRPPLGYEEILDCRIASITL